MKHQYLAGFIGTLFWIVKGAKIIPEDKNWHPNLTILIGFVTVSLTGFRDMNSMYSKNVEARNRLVDRIDIEEKKHDNDNTTLKKKPIGNITLFPLQNFGLSLLYHRIRLCTPKNKYTEI